jgi:tetratricopeptide (TPR) repeat protein
MRRQLMVIILALSSFGSAAWGQPTPATQPASPATQPATPATQPAIAGEPGPTPTEKRAAKARALFDEGVSYAQQQRWSEAAALFRRSWELVKRPNTLFNLGVSLQRMGRVVEALDTLESYMRVSDPDQDAARRAEAQEVMAVARKAVAMLELRVTPPDARVTVDGEPAAGTGQLRSLTLDPGTHNIGVTAPGHFAKRLRVNVGPGSKTDKQIVLAARPPPPPVLPPPPKGPGALPWALGAGSLAVAGTGAVLLAISASKSSELADAPPRSSWSDYEDTHATGSTMRTVGGVLLGAGLAGAAACTVWILLKRPAKADIRASASGFALRARF